MAASHGWERVGAATGIAFVVAVVASFVVIPDTPPQIDDPIADIRSFYVDNDANLQASAYLTGVTAFFLLWFAGSLRAALARAEGDGGRVSAIVLGSSVLALTAGWLVAGLGLAVEDGLLSATGAIGFAVFVLWLAWVLAVSIALLRRLGAEQPA